MQVSQVSNQQDTDKKLWPYLLIQGQRQITGQSADGHRLMFKGLYAHRK